MKYLVQWTPRGNADEAMQKRSLQVFSQWAPSENATFHQFLGRIDNGGGFAVIETDDPSTIARDAATFGVFFDFEAHPCLDIVDATMIGAAAVEFREAIA